MKAAEESSSTVDTQKLVDDLKEKVNQKSQTRSKFRIYDSNAYLFHKLQWDKVEDKPAVALYAGGGVLAIWLASAIVGAISSIPLVSMHCLLSFLVTPF